MSHAFKSLAIFDAGLGSMKGISRISKCTAFNAALNASSQFANCYLEKLLEQPLSQGKQ